MFTDQNNILCLTREKRVVVFLFFNTAEQYSRDVRGSYRTMGAWQFTFIGFNMTHCLLAKTEHQQEIDSKNKEQAPSAFPHILYILPRRRARKGPVRIFPPSHTKSKLCMSEDDHIFFFFFGCKFGESERGSLEFTSGFNMLRRKGLQQHLPAHGKGQRDWRECERSSRWNNRTFESF